ncbi:hypothetical protein [Persephonella sp.]
MDVLVMLNKHLKKLEELGSVEELDSLINELKSINDAQLKKDINRENIQEVNRLISQIIKQVEKAKEETLKKLKTSDTQLKGIKAYSKNHL